jgi:ferric-dicitrate binding protein FerR (iron transport regulator)
VADEGEPTVTLSDPTFERLLDGDLSPAELAALNAALAADPALRRAFLDRASLGVAIAEHLKLAAHVEPVRPRSTVLRVVPWVGIAAALFVGVFLFLPRSEAVAEVVAVEGEVWRVGPAGEEVCPAGTPLRSGDTLRTGGPTAGAALRYPDGTRVALGGDTAVTVSSPGFKLLQVSRGDVSADVAPQPAGRPMGVETPDAVVEVLGTQLTVSSAGGKRTDVGVSHGEVRVTDLARKDTITVKAGEAATVSPAARPKPRIQSVVPPTWAVDPVSGWQAGTVVRMPGPAGEEITAARAEPVWKKERGTAFHQVMCHNAWVDGLFAIRPATVLHCDLLVERPGFVQAFVVARNAVPDPTCSAQVYLMDGIAKNLSAGDWHTLHLPLKDFKLTRNWTPFRDPCAYLVFFDSQVPDIGLTVGRVWVTAGE